MENNNMQNYQQPVMQPATPDVSGKATGSLVCGILSVTCCGWIMGIIALVLGNQALAVDATNGKAKAGKILGIIGIVLGVIGVIVNIITMFTGDGGAYADLMNSMNY